jgi:hypothetical protein
MMDSTLIQPTQVQTSIPSVFNPSAWATAIGGWTSTVEKNLGIDGAANSSTAATALQQPNGQPAPVAVAGSAPATDGGWLSGIATSVESKVSGGVSAVGGWFSGIGSGVTSTITGTIDLVHWLVIGLVAVAVIYIIVQLRVLRSVAP